MTTTETGGLYKKASAAVDRWLELHKGESFDLDTICRQMNITDPEKRNLITIKLAYEVKHGSLEKSNRLYRVIDNNIITINWLKSDETETFDLTWPWSHEDNTVFGFSEHVSLSPRDIAVIAGRSNSGKTTFCINVLAENADKHPCTLMGNEYSPSQFKRQMLRMGWFNPVKDDGTPKFELIERFDNWKDVIRPDGLNIIDWITVPDSEYYKIDNIFRGIQQKLNKGVAIIAIQKGAGLDLGEGGEKSVRVPRVYLSMDFDRLTVIKAKDWNGVNPNGKTYAFTIVEGGTQFHNIREVSKCKKCNGRGNFSGKDCDVCRGTGFIDKDSVGRF